MKKYVFLSLLVILGVAGSLCATTPSQNSFGIVNFATCVAESKLGKQEQASFESLKKQMTTLLEDTERQLNEINAQFSDPEIIDQLSPEAEGDLKTKFQTLSEELNRYQNQYYQVLNQANMRIFQVINGSINDASERVAKEKKLAMVINKEACFFYTPSLDITSSIIIEMDRRFADLKKASASAQPEETTPSTKEPLKAASKTE
jgi:outer membrane protein